MKFYGTFGQIHKEGVSPTAGVVRGSKVPKSMISLKDYYVEIFADNWRRALDLMKGTYSDHWSYLYEKQKFDESYFPKGKLTTLGVKSPEDEAEEIIEKIYEQRTNNRKAERARNSDEQLLS